MKKVKKADYEKALKYAQLMGVKDFDFIMNDIADVIKQARDRNVIETNMEEMYRKNWNLNGWSECRNYILSQLEIVNGVKTGKYHVEIKDEQSNNRG